MLYLHDGDFKVEWDTLFLETMTDLANSGPKLDDDLVINRDGILSVGSSTLHSGTKSIIDDILIWSSNIPSILIYIECVCKLFQKYRVSFILEIALSYKREWSS